MNYKEIVRLDGEIEELERCISELSGKVGSVIFGNIQFEINTSYNCSLSNWRRKNVAFILVKNEILAKLKAKKQELRNQRSRLISKKWYQFWL